MGTTDWDVEINGTGHFLYPTNEYRYTRDAIAVQRDQIDTSSEPGEQSLTSWWYRSQSSFHLGMGQEFFDTVKNNQTDQYRFDDSYGVNPFVKGEVTLQANPVQAGDYNADNGQTTYDPKTLGKPAQFSLSDGTSGIIYPSGGSIYKLTWKPPGADGKLDSQVLNLDYEEGATDAPNMVLDVCTMGDYVWYWCLSNDRSRAEIRRTLIKQDPDPNKAKGKTKVYWFAGMNSGANGNLGINIGTGSGDNWRTARLSFRNSVLAATMGRYWWSLPDPETIKRTEELNYNTTPRGAVGETPAPKNRLVFKHPDRNYCFLDVARSNGPMIATGTQVWEDSIVYGNRSHLWACLASEEQDSDILELEPPFVTAETPAGETIFRMDLSMNFIFLGTNEGLRVAEMDTKGDVLLGPPHETDFPVFDCANFGPYVWFTGSKTGGLYRLDLRNAVNRQSYTFAYCRDAELGSWADDTHKDAVTAGKLPREADSALHVEMFGNSGGPIWFLGNPTTRKGYFYATWEADITQGSSVIEGGKLVERARLNTGWIRTPRLRMDTWEFKLFQYLRTLWDPQRATDSGEGSIKPSWIKVRGGDPAPLAPDPYYVVCDKKGYVDTPGSYPPPDSRGPMLDIGYQFQLLDSPNNDTSNRMHPTFKGYQVKAKPTNVADKELQLPLLCARREKMRQGRTVERSTWDRVKEMEKLQRTGEIVDYKNLGTGEEGKVIIDSCQFISTYVPQSKQEQEDRLGILLVKLRIVESPDYS